MRAALTAALLCATAAGAQPMDRFNANGGGLRSPVLFRLLHGTITASQECTGSSLTGHKGQAVTFTRSSAAWCTKSDGTLVSLTNNQPRLESAGLLVEGTATNLVLHNRDLSQAAWTPTNATCTKTATGVDGSANSATSCVATAGNATVCQSLTVAAATRTTSLYVRQPTQTGDVDLTRNNGTAWTTLDAGECKLVTTGGASNIKTAEWVRCQLASSVLNPTICVRIVNVDDVVEIDLVQDEASAFATSPITTAGTSATRSTEAATVTLTAPSSAAGLATAVTYKSVGAHGSGIIVMDYGIDVNSRFQHSNNNGSAGVCTWVSTGGTVTQTVNGTADTASVRQVCRWNGSNGVTTEYTGGTTATTTGAASNFIPATLALGKGIPFASNFYGHLSNVCVSKTPTGCQ